jgi:hypothetical protein
MTIATTSTYFEVALATPVKPSATDLTAWSTVTLTTTTDTYFASTEGIFVGLFGYDLTSFFAYCVTSTSCNDTDYNATYFDGWSVGGEIIIADTYDADLQSLTLGVCLEEIAGCFGITGDGTASAANTIASAWNSVYNAATVWSATVPDSGSVDVYTIDTDTASEGYGFWPAFFAAPTVYTADVTTAYFVNF